MASNSIHLVLANIYLTGVPDQDNRWIAAEILQLADGAHHDPVEAVHHCGSLLDGFLVRQSRRLPTCFFLALVNRLQCRARRQHFEPMLVLPMHLHQGVDE